MMKLNRLAKPFGLFFLFIFGGNVMALDFTFPGTGTGEGSTGNAASKTLIFVCSIPGIGTTGVNSSSCSNSGSGSSTCESSTVSGESKVVSWESSAEIDNGLETILNNALSCAEAVEAAGTCQASGAGSNIIYTCDI